jgi:hypothetical protein
VLSLRWLNRPDLAAPLDALILASPDASSFAQELGTELERWGLRTRVTSVSQEAGSPIPTALGQDAGEVRLCVVLGIVDDKPCYALLPAPKVPSEEPRFAPQGKHGAPDEVEIGPLTEDAKTLAARIAARLSPRARS